MKKLDSLLDKIEGTLCTLFACVMAVAILFQVINRNTFQLPFTWGEELARYCMVWLMFIGIKRCTYWRGCSGEPFAGED